MKLGGVGRGRGPKGTTIALIAMAGFGLTAPWFATAYGQSKGPEWTTSSFDMQRDAWQRNESKITPANAKDLQLLWKVKLSVKTKGMQAFREPMILSGISTADGTKDLAILIGSSNEVYALDADTGSVVWQKKLKWSSAKPEQAGEGGGGFICTNALTANPVVTPAGATERFVYVLSSDGYLHSLALASGEEANAPIQMLPQPYGKPYGLNLFHNVIYTITGQGCGGDPNALYAADLTNGKVTISKPPQAGLWGVAGATIGSDGTIYFESGDGFYDAKTGRLSTSVEAFTFSNDTLTLKDYYSPINHDWLTRRDLDMNGTPVLFEYKGKEMLVGSGKEGRFFLMDSTSLGGADHETPLDRTPLFSNTNANFQTEGTWGSHASWRSKDGTRWVLAPTGSEAAVKFPITHGAAPHGGIIAMKVEEKAGKFKLVPAWQSRDMVTAEPPVIANGVVFTLGGGEFTGQANAVDGGLYSANQRIAKSLPAKLFLLDAKTGEQLYSSGNEIRSFVHQAGLSVAGGRVIFGTFDGTVYCYGIK